jgi:NodT family efflux transporter outer membrane factor (OMF) lipoprotein
MILASACANLSIVPERIAVEPTVETPVPEVWSEPAPQDLPTTDWVSSFSDATLVALVDEALVSNTDIRQAEARYKAALAQVDISEADLIPNVSGTGRVARTENTDDFIPDRTSLTAGLNANWELDLWGRIRDRVDASGLQATASSEDYAGARLAIAGQVAQAWFGVIESHLLVELSERDVETQARALTLTERRSEGGIAGSSDVRLASSALANSEALQASRRQLFSANRRRLEVLLRRYPAEDIEAATDLPNLPVLEGVGTPEDMLRKRPDILAAERRLRAQGLQVDIARKNLLPRLSLDVSGSQGSAGLNSIFDIDGLVATLAANLTQPIFQGGRLRGDIEQQRALLRQLLESYAGTALDAYLEVENALDAEVRLVERQVALERAVMDASEAERLIEIRYREGLATILRLLDAQSRRLSAEGQLITARGERLANRVRLHIALGGGLETVDTHSFY